MENAFEAGNQTLELQFNAGKDDAALGQPDADHSRSRRARSPTERKENTETDKGF